MEVIRPQLVWLGTRCYRKNATKESSHFNPEDEDIGDTDPAGMMYCDEICDMGLDIEETNRGYRLKMAVPNAFYKYIIGKKGETKKRLETETKTQIYVPKPGEKEKFISITGQEKKGIVSAKTRIDVLVNSARQNQPFTHFLSIPVTSDDVIMGFENFKDDILLHCDGEQGVDASIFQNPKKLHLTICTLALLSDEEIQQAASILESSQEELIGPILKGERLAIEFAGLEYMNDDPRAVDVLYAKVKQGDAADRLQMVVDRLADRFVSAGLAQQEYERVKLHVTVMNTLFRKDSADSGAGRDRGRGPRESFDATKVLKNFGNHNFGSVKVPSIHLSQRFSTGPDQYYQCVSQVPLSLS